MMSLNSSVAPRWWASIAHVNVMRKTSALAKNDARGQESEAAVIKSKSRGTIPASNLSHVMAIHVGRAVADGSLQAASWYMEVMMVAREPFSLRDTKGVMVFRLKYY